MQDLFVAADILEVQLADRAGWFLGRDPPLYEDTVEIQTLYSHLQEVDASTMISELAQDAVYRFLPPSIRGCIRAYNTLRKWLIMKLTSLRLGLRLRQERMELILRAIEVARLRSAEIAFPPPSVTERPCIRTFVEAVLTAAVISVESRLHTRAWHNIAALRGVTCDTLTSLLSKSATTSTSLVYRDSLTVDVGWLMERLLELISIPDIVDSGSHDNQSLINFHKRR